MNVDAPHTNLGLQLLLLLGGAIIGAILSYLIPLWHSNLKRRRQRQTIEVRRALLESKEVTQWLLEYYSRQHDLHELFDCRIGNYEAKVPFLTKSDWQYYKRIHSGENAVLRYAETSDQGFEINARLIRERRELGQRLFPGPTLYLDRLEERNSSITLHVKSCDYFQMVTQLALLEEETFKAVRKNSYEAVPLRGLCLSNLAQAQKLLKKPFSIGCVTALAVRTDDSYEIVIQTRSHATITFGGTKSGIPNYGLVPIVGEKDQTNIMLYNFIKEYCEELFNYEDLIEDVSNNRADPYWFYELPEAQQLLSMMRENKFTLEFLGFGFDALNGTSTIALLAAIEDDAASVGLKKRLCANWEVASRTPYFTRSIEFVDYRSSQLETWLRDNQYHFGSAFTIARAIEKLDILRGKGPSFKKD